MAWFLTINIRNLKMTKVILEGKVECKSEDSGCALIAEIEGNDEFFVRLHSWSDNKNHKFMKNIKGKKVRVTVEIID